MSNIQLAAALALAGEGIITPDYSFNKREYFQNSSELNARITQDNSDLLFLDAINALKRNSAQKTDIKLILSQNPRIKTAMKKARSYVVPNLYCKK